MDNIVVRTDLAVEANEEAMNGTGKLRGIRLRESKKSRMGVKVTELQVTNHLGEAAIGRQMILQVGTKNMQKRLYQHWQAIYLSS